MMWVQQISQSLHSCNEQERVTRVTWVTRVTRVTWVTRVTRVTRATASNPDHDERPQPRGDDKDAMCSGRLSVSDPATRGFKVTQGRTRCGFVDEFTVLRRGRGGGGADRRKQLARCHSGTRAMQRKLMAGARRRQE